MDRRTFLGSASFAAASPLLQSIPSPPKAPVAPDPGFAMPSAAALRDLSKQLGGRIVTRGSPGCGTFNVLSNDRFTAVQPAAIAQCTSVEDIAACVRWAREHRVPIAPRAGGHNFAGYSTTPGLVVAVTDMKMARLDEATGTLDAEAGIQNQDLRALLPKGGEGRWVFSGGTCPTVGAAGLTLGGGMGPNSRWAGLTCDLLTEATVVTADGEVVVANESSHPDLFWALRGSAGRNFGICSAFKYRLAPRPHRESTVYGLEFETRDSCAAAAKAILRGMRSAPASSSVLMIASTWPEGVGCVLWGQHFGDDPQAGALRKELLSLGPAASFERTMPWWDAQSWLMGSPASPRPYLDRSRFVRDAVPDEAIDDLFLRLERYPGVTDDRFGQVAIYGWTGGVINSVPRTATAFVHRDSTAVIRISGVWKLGDDRPAGAAPVPGDIGEWVDGAWGMILPHATDESYQNFPDPRLKDWAEAYYGENLPRLRQVKSRYDPTNVFAFDQAIPAAV
jgi:FAD/FMN-containing dehydrogenase